MGRYCAVHGCLSGKKAKGSLKKVPFFRAPKDVEMLRKWSTALDKELKPCSYICELHFDSEDVIKSTQIQKDGSIYVFDYQKAHLRKNAVPKLNVTTNNKENKNLSSVVVHPNTSKIIGGCNLNTIEFIEIKPVNNILNKVNEPEEFSLNTLETFLENQPLRKKWSWTGIKNSHISLSYINLKLELVCHVNIDMDLIVTIVNAKTNVVIDMDVNISSIDCVLQLLSCLERSLFCSGTGYNDKKCSVTCTGMLFLDDTYKKLVMEHRCMSCRKLRQMIQSCKSKAQGVNVKNRLILECRKVKTVVQDVKSIEEPKEKEEVETKEIQDPDDIVNEIIIDDNVNYTTIKMTKMEMLESLEQRKLVESFLEAEFKCEWCVEVYKDEMEQQVHMSRAHDKKPNHTKCDICTTYVRKRWFPEHRRDHYLKFQCHFCDFVAYNQLVILRHLNIVHAVRNPPDEMRKLRKRSYIKNPGLKPCWVDVGTNLKSLRYKCSKCNEVFETKNERSLHLQQAHKIEYKCTVCSKTFTGSCSLRKHEQIHNGTVPKVICPTCGKSIRHDTMSYHMKVHSRREARVCVPCDRTFVSDAGYRRHLRFSQQHGDGFRIRCPICLKGFRNNRDKRDHVNYTHKGITIHKCAICDKVASSEFHLKRHLRNKHLGKKEKRKSYLCPICGHLCRDSMVLREHESLHTGVLTFSCELCDKKFRTFTRLYIHKRRFHKVKPTQKVVKHVEMDSGEVEE